MSSVRPMPAWLAAFPSRQVREMDTRRHALLEASAGTGKTFAIEHLVMRLLVENGKWNPEEVLLLSFTDKTVAELRDRIRDLLRAQVDDSSPKKRVPGWSDEERGRLRALWLHADDLSIHTLHAFCQSAVQRDPLENGALIRTELTDDRALADQALDGLLRGAWTREPARFERLRAALDIDAREGWRKRLIALALKWQPWRGDVFDPPCDPNDLEALEAEAALEAQALPSAVKAVDECGYSVGAFRRDAVLTKRGTPSANGDDTLRKHAFQKVFRFCEDGVFTVEATLAFFLKKFTKRMKAVRNGWESEIPLGGRDLPAWKRLAELCTRLRDLAEAIDVAKRIRMLGLQAEAARELREALDAEKLRLGRISYDDMPRRLVEALRRNPTLAARLRARYKICIVDEFQDTDPIQWEILQRLCLEDRRDDERGLPLVLVGDPKQAIYAFRGGDLRTYLRARETFLDMARAGKAQGIGLNANFRSRPALIGALNLLFAHERWFGPQPDAPADRSWQLPGKTDGIAFVPVQAGLKEDGGAADVAPAVVARDFAAILGAVDGENVETPLTTIGALRRDVRRWIVARITEALRDGKKSGVRPGDFAVLTRSGNEGDSIARLLRRHGVPCRIRRRTGVFHGPAADALRLLIEWIEEAGAPDAQARILLLPFARRDAQDLPAGRPESCPPLIARWAALAQAGRWPEFLNAVSHEGGYRDRLATSSPADAARFDRLVQLLAEAGSAPGTSARTLCERFDLLRRSTESLDGDDADFGAGDGSDDADEAGFVTVMTLHLSKGLEFRHVFIAATGAGRGDNHLVLRDDNRTGFRIALDTKRQADKDQADREAQEENLRLYYVALTRAKETVHVPVLPDKVGKSGTGPLGGFVAEAVRAVAGNGNLHVRWDQEPVRETFRISADAKQSPPAAVPNEDGKKWDTLVATSRAAFARRRQLTSYSRLAHQTASPHDLGAAIPVEPLLEDDGTRAQRQEPVPEDVNEFPVSDSAALASSEKDTVTEGITAAELPPGASAGTALHALLEHTSFASVLEAESPEAWTELPGVRARIEKTLRQEGLDAAFVPGAARAVWNALRCPLPVPRRGGEVSDAKHATFRLADLSPGDVRHEVEFLLPFGSGAGSSPLPSGIARRGQFLWGFIDLVFRHEGRYYLLDWKSNLLTKYDTENVRDSMEKHRYDLQWKLYAIALDRWLTARLRGYDAKVHFGGVHYLFLRGATPETFAGFSDRPTVEQLRETFPAEIAGLLGAPVRGEAA